MEADTTTITEEEHRGTQRLVLKGNYGKLTLKENGGFDARTDSVMIGVFNGLSIYDFAMRFYSDLDDEAKEAAIEFVEKHKDKMFNGEPKPHTLKGDSQTFRISHDDRQMLAEDILADLAVEPGIVSEDTLDDFADHMVYEVTSEVGPHDILLEAVEDVASEIKDEVEHTDVETAFEEDWWGRIIHDRFFHHKSRMIYDELAEYDIAEEFEIWLLEEVMDDEIVIWDIYYDYNTDEWKLKDTEADTVKRSAEIKRRIKTNDILEGDGPAILRIRKMNGEIEETRYVGDAQYFDLMNDDDRENALNFLDMKTECEAVTAPENDGNQQTLETVQ